MSYSSELRVAVQLLTSDLNAPNTERSILRDLLSKKGGYYRKTVNRESVMFPVYSNVSFAPLTLDRRGVSCGVEFDAPPGNGARSPRAAERAAYWEHKKKLMQGSLVALLWKSAGEVQVYLGIVTTSSKDLVASVRNNANPLRVRISISFFDPQVETRILDDIKRSSRSHGGHDTRILTECPIMYESIRPFLEALRVEPTTVPFDRYLSHTLTGRLEDVELSPPVYSTLPNFTFDIGCLFRPGSGVTSLKLCTTDRQSIAAARAAMKAPFAEDPSLCSSQLDPSQADAIIDALTSEVSLTQG